MTPQVPEMPETEAGRALVEEWYPRDGDGLDAIELQSFREQVIAIEAQATAAARAEVAAKVRELEVYGCVGMFESPELLRRDAVLAIVEQDAAPEAAAAARADSLLAVPDGAVDLDALGDAMWFEGLIADKDAAPDAAASLWSAYHGMLKHAAALRAASLQAPPEPGGRDAG